MRKIAHAVVILIPIGIVAPGAALAQSSSSPSASPFAWQPHAATIGTTKGSPIVRISPADAQRLRDGDHITVAGCAACDTIVSGGGTTTVTLNASATVTNARAAATVGLARYDAASSIVASTVGADTVLIGAAARGYGDWAGLYDGPGRYRAISPLKVISREGTSAATFASRLSDTPRGSGLKSMRNVVHMAILDSRPAGIDGGGWNIYNESRLLSASQPALNALGFISVEDSIFSKWSSPRLDPYQTNLTGYTENYRPDCGTGYERSSDCSAAIHVINNGARYKSGIIFGQDALATDDPRGVADAVAMASRQSLSWYRSANTVAWSIVSVAARGSHAITLRDADVSISEAALSLDGASGSRNRALNLTAGDRTLWSIGATSTAQSGGNAGADYAVARFDDAGSYVGIPLFVQRSTGNVGINQADAKYALDVNGTTSATLLHLRPTKFADLPPCDGPHAGTVAHVADSRVPVTAWHQRVTAGGGSDKAFVTCNGTGWFVFSY